MQIRAFVYIALFSALSVFVAHDAIAQIQPSFGTLTGRVVVKGTNVPLADASVSIVGLTLSGRSDSGGHYVLRSIPSGIQTIRIQHPGFQAGEKRVDILADASTLLDLSIARVIVSLDTSHIKSDNWIHKPARLVDTDKYDEFYERKTMSQGGVQLTHEDLEKRVNTNLVEAFSSIPGVHIARRGSRYGIGLPGCPATRMAVFVDNQQVYPVGGGNEKAIFPAPSPGSVSFPDDGPLDVLAGLDLQNVEAIEFYKSISGMPAKARGNSCAAIFIWTR